MIRPLLAVLLMLLAACGQGSDAALQIVQGQLVSVSATEVCLESGVGAPEDERLRCFVLGEGDVPPDAEEGTLLRVHYEVEGQREIAVDIEPVIEEPEEP